MTQWCQGCPGPVAEPHQCTCQLLPRHNEVLSWTYSTCSATRREHHTKSQRPETARYPRAMQSHMARLFLSKSGRFRCRKLRFGAESTEVKWYGWGVPRVQYLTDSEMSTCQLLHSASTASTASTPPWDHPIPCQKSSAPAICRQLHTIHGRWQSFLHWCYTFDATNMKNSSHQGKTYKL